MWRQLKRLLGRSQETAEPDLVSYTPLPPSPFLEQILRTHYGQASDAQPFVFKPTQSDEVVQDLAQRWEEIPRGRLDLPRSAHKRLDRVGSPATIEGILESGLSLTPGGNVLGVIHRGVMEMTADQNPRFREVPIAIAKDVRLRGRLFYNQAGDMAIVLSMGYFWELYVLNKITHRALHDEAIDTLEETWALFAVLLSHLSHYIGAQADEPEPLQRPGEPLYRDRTEFQRIHFITHAQLQFVLLHEFGHVVQLLSAGPRASPKPEWDSDLERDVDADAWAARQIAKAGERYYLPWMQLRSIFWLFEFYYIVEALEGSGGDLTARPRFDALVGIIDHRRALLQRSYIHDVRWTIDHFMQNADSLPAGA